MRPSLSALEEALEQVFGRTTAINADRCIPQPVGCGQVATEFRDALSQREYQIIGLCQKCQDKIFGDGSQ